MSPAEQTVLLGAVGAGATMLGSYVVARITARQSKHATDTTAELTKEANAVSGFRDLVTDLQEELHRLRRDHEDLRRDFEAVKRELGRKNTLIRHLIAYVHTLRGALRGFGHPVPEAPAGLDHEGGPLA